MATTKKRLKAAKGKAAAALGLRHAHQVLASAVVRHESIDGRDMLIAPIVILTRTVIDCATCPVPELEIPEEFAKNPAAWNGEPVCYDHPRAAGRYISAHDGMAEPFIIGSIHGARRQGDKLAAEVWLDVVTAKERGAGELLDRIEAGEVVEISPGFYDDVRVEAGEWNGKKYGAIGINVTPDHVACLPPTERGACSWDDGCGIRAAKPAATVKAACEGCSAEVACPKCALRDVLRQFAIGEVSDNDLRESLDIRLQEANQDAEFCFVTDVFPSRVIFVMDGYQYQQSYSADEKGEAALEGEPERVRSITDYVRVSQEAKMNRQQMIDRILAAKKLNAERQKALRASLEKLDDDSLKVMAEAEPAGETDEEKKAREDAVALKAKADADAAAAEKQRLDDEATAKAAKAAAAASTPTPEQQWLIARLAKERGKLTERIKAATKAYSDDMLKGMEFEVLEATADAVAPIKDASSHDYSGQGGVRNGDQGNGDPLAENVKGFDAKVAELRGGRKTATA